MTVFTQFGKRKGRWGKKFVDRRDWGAYNEELVVRGEFLLELEWVKSWGPELAAMNSHKRGKPFVFPESLIRLQAVWHQMVDYRGVEGVTRKLAEYGMVPHYNTFSAINRRVNKLDISFTLPRSGSVAAACDGSGVKMENGGEHRAKLYGKKKRRYAKVIITADPVTKELLDCEVFVEGEGPSEPEFAKRSMGSLMDQGLHIDKFWGDGSYDDIGLFGFLEKNGIAPAIKPRKNAVPSGDDTLRDKEIEERNRLGYKDWAIKCRYGTRWNGTEGIFSAVKRKFGECTRAHIIENALTEAKMKFWAYQTMKTYGRA